MDKMLYYFIVVDKNGKRYGKKEICTETEAINIAQKLCVTYPHTYYYAKNEWKDEGAMFWFFRSGLNYNGLFNDKI